MRGVRSRATVAGEQRYAFLVESANVPFLRTMVEDVLLAPTAEAGVTAVTYTQAVELKRWAAPIRTTFERQLRTALQQGLAGLPVWLQQQRH